jgi:phosphate transport system permease protein
MDNPYSRPLGTSAEQYEGGRFRIADLPFRLLGKLGAGDDGAMQERLFRLTLLLAAIVVVGVVAATLVTLLIGSSASLKAFGFSFLTGTTWDPVSGVFGSLPFLVGTLVSSLLALLICIPFSLAISLFLGELFRQGPASTILKSAVELLAGIPSVIYGFWALLALVPIVRQLQIWLGVPPYGVGLFTASLILAVMIVPYSASIGREVIALTPAELKEAAYSLGATRFDVVRRVVLPYARSGITAGILLAWGRALGETMAVTMVIGNANVLPSGLFSPSNTMASVIANEFTEATGSLYLSSLIEIGLLLFLVTAVVNVVGKFFIRRWQTT